MPFRIEPSPLGRIVTADVPAGFALFYTTLDFDGALTVPRAKIIGDLLRERFGIEATLATCTQVHGCRVHRVTAGREIGASREYHDADTCDALWSAEGGVALGIKIADCLPVTIIDAARRCIVNVHSGWRGAAQRITAAALDTAGAHVDPREALAFLGPTIRVCCFEVGEEVVEQLRGAHDDADRFIDRSRAKAHVDVAGLTAALLAARGFRRENIFDSGLCTRCDGSIFHSYRRDGARSGRNLAIVAQR